MKYYLKYVYWKIRIAYLSFKWVFKLNIGDDVIYKGGVYMLSQGVMNPKWNLVGNGEYLENIHKNDFRKVVSIKNYYRSFKSGWNFYNQNWFGIWMRNGIEDWMKRCNIW